MEKKMTGNLSLPLVMEGRIVRDEQSTVDPVRLDKTKSIDRRLERIEALLIDLVERQQVREWYTIEEFARIIHRSEFTCREYCRLGRIHAEKRMSGRGAYASWVISHVEVQRYQREGLLPLHRCI